MNNERLPETEQGRKVIFDIHCETDKGERIIIEMQNTPAGADDEGIFTGHKERNPENIWRCCPG